MFYQALHSCFVEFVIVAVLLYFLGMLGDFHTPPHKTQERLQQLLERKGCNHASKLFN